MTEKEILGGLSFVMGMACFAVSIWAFYRGSTKPHLFTWLLWSILLSIAFAVQVVENAGPGSWHIGISALIAFFIVGVSFFRGEKHITKSDWAAFIIAMSAIPVWQMTGNPLWAIIIVSMIDAAAYYPTFRKSWMKPWEEPALAYFIGMVQFSLSLFALERVAFTTALYPAVVVAMNVTMVLLLLCRRKVLTLA